LSDIVKGVLAGSWGLLAGWVLPVGVTIALFGVLVLPSLGDWTAFTALASASAGVKGLVLLIASIVIGLTLSTMSTPLYRILEGYASIWPASWKKKRIEYHRSRRQNLRDAVTKHPNESGNPAVVDADATTKRLNESGTSAVMNALALEKFNRYPDDNAQVAPTLLGNAIRRFEYYSFDRYRLDSQLCWYHLRAATPESMGKEIDNARSGVDFFVCLLYMLILLAMTAVAAMFTPSPDWFRLGIATVLGVAGAVGSYYAAVKATDAWSSSVKAMVDIGRIPLAKALGLEIPAKLAEERDMWERVDWLLGFAYKPEAGTELDSYRQSSHTDSDERP
jgi:hypothetical protein